MLDRRLDHIVAVARAGSFTKAAQTVGITQSGLTKSIADLERELGYSLFYRTARGVLLTEQGREFVERASRLLEDARVLLEGNEEKDPFAKVLRIGVCPASLEWLLADPLATLLNRHPKIVFDVVGSTVERIVQLLRNGGVDVAVGFEAAFAEWVDLKRTAIAAISAIPFARKGHPIFKRTATKANLAEFIFVAPSDSRPYGSIIRELYENDVVPWQRRVHIIDHFSIAKRIVATSDAIGVTTTEYASSARFMATFARVPGRSPFPPLPMCCAIRSRWVTTPAVKSFLRVMRQRLPSDEQKK